MKRAVGSRCGGLLSRELVQTWRTPGWHVLPNGIVAYADRWRLSSWMRETTSMRRAISDDNDIDESAGRVGSGFNLRMLPATEMRKILSEL